MIVKLLAPTRTDFSIIYDRSLTDAKAYREFWETATDSKPELRSSLSNDMLNSLDLAEVHFSHAPQFWKDSYNRYRSLTSDSLERKTHVLELRLNGNRLAQEPDGDPNDPATWLYTGVSTILWRVYNHGISLLEVDCDIGNRLTKISNDKIPDVVDDLQIEAISMVSHIAKNCTEKVLNPLFMWIRKFHSNSKVFIEPSITRDKEASGNVLWTDRALVFQRNDVINRAAIIKHWIKDSISENNKTDMGRLKNLLQDSKSHYTCWLNYIFRESSYEVTNTMPVDDDGLVKPFCDSWEAILNTQYYYAAMDVVDLQLTRILAESSSLSSSPRLTVVENLLKRNMHKANLLLLQYHDNTKYYKRTVKKEMDELFNYWEFDRVLVGPVKHKTKLCQDRLSTLHQQAVKQSSVFTDVILFGIAITAIFEIFLMFVNYGRTIAHDSSYFSYDIKTQNFIGFLASQPTDVILVLATLLTMFLVLLYVFFRKRQTA